MSLKLYMVRHGQAECNLAEVFHDDSKDELTMVGKMQAVSAGRNLKDYDVDFDAVYCSPYERTMATCAIALDNAGLKDMLKNVHYDERLVERQLTGLFDKKFDKDEWVYLQSLNPEVAVNAGIETFDSMEKRAQSFISEMKAIYPNGDILVFTHGLIELAFYATAYGRPASGNTYDLPLLNNAEMRIYEF